jgi:serine/threonine protein kinase
MATSHSLSGIDLSDYALETIRDDGAFVLCRGFRTATSLLGEDWARSRWSSGSCGSASVWPRRSAHCTAGASCINTTPEPPEVIAGTLPYMAPEQTGRMNRSIDSRSDLYALGVTL